MTIVAETMSEDAVADHTKQNLAEEDRVLRALGDNPTLGLMPRSPTMPDGSATTAGRKGGGCSGSSAGSPTTS